MYLGSDLDSCIVFEIEHRVELSEDERRRGEIQRRLPGRKLKVGNRMGVERARSGFVTARSFENVTIELELRREGYFNDLMVTLATPTADIARNRAVLLKFLGSFNFTEF